LAQVRKQNKNKLVGQSKNWGHVFTLQSSRQPLLGGGYSSSEDSLESEVTVTAVDDAFAAAARGAVLGGLSTRAKATQSAAQTTHAQLPATYATATAAETTNMPTPLLAARLWPSPDRPGCTFANSEIKIEVRLCCTSIRPFSTSGCHGRVLCTQDSSSLVDLWCGVCA
jgi:hypothetical protein